MAAEFEDVRQCIDKVKRFLGVGKDADLARKIGTSPATLSSWIMRNRIPPRGLRLIAATGALAQQDSIAAIITDLEALVARLRALSED